MSLRFSSLSLKNIVRNLALMILIKVVEAIGFSGGLWTLWNNSKIKMSVFNFTNRSISLQVTGIDFTWILTCIYASPCKPSRQELWNYLAALHSTY